jgi:hypothetical protein
VTSRGQTLLWPQLEMLAPPSPDAGMRFGNAVDVSGDRAIAGAPMIGNYTGTPFTRPGLAYIFVRQGDTWELEATLTASDRAARDQFGASVTIDGNYAAVGATGVDNGGSDFGGAAYVFERDTTTGAWNEVTKVAEHEPSDDNPYFGQSIHLDGERLVVSAYKADRGISNDNGVVYIYERQGDGAWTPAVAPSGDGGSSQVVLQASNHFHGDQLGISCRVSGDVVVAGAWQKNAFRDAGFVTNTGAMLVFERQPDGSWLETQQITPDDVVAGDLFGVTVSIDGDTIVGGTFNQDAVTGAAYVYRRSMGDASTSGSWVLEQKLLASDAAEGARFGTNVSISGDWLLVGSPRANTTSTDRAGKIYLFERQGTTWTEDRIVTATPEQFEGSFGFQVALDGAVALAGAHTYDLPDDSGRAFVFEGVPPIPLGEACTESQRCDSGHCEDGVCCDTACGICQACVQSKSGQPDGTCAPIPAGQDPDSDCTDPTCTSGVQTGNECDGAGQCDTGQYECAPYRCAESGGVCATQCTDNTSCATESFCDTSTSTCAGTRTPGDACTRDDQCASSNCVDGVCCNSSCVGQCEACDLEGSEGTCSAVVGAPRGSRPACVDNGDECAGSCDGANRNSCTYRGGATVCAESTCEGMTEQPFRCDGAGQCVEATTVSCSPFACGETSCRTDCSSEDHCGAGFVCTDSNCVVPPPTSSEGCSGTAECPSGFYCDRGASRCRRIERRPTSPDLGLLCAAAPGRHAPSSGLFVFGLAAAAVGLRRMRRR